MKIASRAIPEGLAGHSLSTTAIIKPGTYEPLPFFNVAMLHHIYLVTIAIVL